MESREGNENIEVDPGEGLLNRTGIMLHPDLAAELIQGAKQTVPSSEGDTTDMEAERAEYVHESLPIGSCPSLVSESELTTEEELSPRDDRMAVLLDKLGERLAFERQGTRLYEAFIQKIEAMPVQDTNAPAVENLRHICEQELEHFKLLQQAIVELGGDATVQTPSADVAGVLAHGVLQVMSDPRTTVAQALQAALTAELADNDGWKMLQELAEQLEEGDLADQCARAYEQEQEHLESVRTWLSNMVLSEAVGAEALIDADAEGNEEESDSKSTKKRSASTARPKSSASNKKRKK